MNSLGILSKTEIKTTIIFEILNVFHFPFSLNGQNIFIYFILLIMTYTTLQSTLFPKKYNSKSLRAFTQGRGSMGAGMQQRSLVADNIY